MSTYDFVTVGSAVSDVFVQTEKEFAKIKEHGSHHDVCYHIGSKILISDIHFETGGGGTNTAVAFARLGFKTGYVGKIGDDRNSDHMLDILKKEHIDFLGGRGIGQMGFSVIIVGLQHDRTILTYKGVNNSLDFTDIKKAALKAKRYYFSSMLGTSWNTICRLAQFATKESIPYTFNPSQYIVQDGPKPLAPLLKGCQLLALNREEAESLTSSPSGCAVNHLLTKLNTWVPYVVVTDGPRGAFAYDGKYKHTILPNPHARVVETTGAGDAFAAGVSAGLEWHMDMDDCLKIGMAEAESVIAHIGAKNVLIDKVLAQDAVRTKKYRMSREVI